MTAFVSRNLKVFFRDKASVFFSLLAVFIIIAMYVLFLGNVWLDGLPDVPQAKPLMDSWIMSGLLAVTSMTTVMGAFGTMVDDRAHKIIKDFSASPISKGKIAGGYILSSFIIGVIMTLITFVLAELYIVAGGGQWLSVEATFKVLGLILLSSLCNTAMISFLISYFKSQNAFGTASSIIGTLIGFLTGIYLPIGMLPEAVQFFIKIFPVSHAALLLRQVIMETPMQAVFEGAPAQVLQGFKEEMGVSFQLGGQTIPVYASFLILIGTALLFYALSTWRFSKKGK
ncbi:MAG: ABC transporter permease [Christensenellales bacterium]|jgi:multidrug/hemolysin transport system permease protein